jgi:hypothetical protein
MRNAIQQAPFVLICKHLCTQFGTVDGAVVVLYVKVFEDGCVGCIAWLQQPVVNSIRINDDKVARQASARGAFSYPSD